MKTLAVLLLATFFAGCAKRQPTPYEAALAAYTTPPQSPQDFRVVYSGIQPFQTSTLSAEHYATLEKTRARVLAARQKESGKAKPTSPSQPLGEPLPSNAYLWDGAVDGRWETVALISRDGRFHSPKIVDARASKILAAQILRMEAERKTGPTAKPVPRIGVVIQKGFIAHPDDSRRRPVDVRGLPSGTEFVDPYNPNAILVVP